ncbi:alpha-2-macroglobulin-like protein 1 [Engraulis encrasicolus]|uniref:alpha-2-macroglobulin-like protein 1 n=1 Tax=Engraulis encrasicolus TaxID=184585 RepID=UPI002FD20001
MALARILIAGGLLSCLLSLCCSQSTPRPSFLVSFPAVVRSESEAKVCASLLSPNETLVMSIYVINGDQKKLIHQETSDKDFHRCFTFQAPEVKEDLLQSVRVEVKGQTTLWTRESRFQFSPKLSPFVLIQTDKPIYSPGQPVHFRLVTLDTDFIPLQQKYHKVTLQDNHDNVIGQWLNVTTEKTLVTLSHPLNPEASQGTYRLMVSAQEGGEKTHTFQVKKYVLPKFEVSVTTPEKLSIGAPEAVLMACAKYTFGQPVPGKAVVTLCRSPDVSYHDDDDLARATLKLCSAETLELDPAGCATHTFDMAAVAGPNINRKMTDYLTFEAAVTEEGTGISRSGSKNIQLDYSLGKAAFVDTPDKIEDGAVLQGKIRATHYNGSVIPYTAVHLFKGPRWSAELLQNLTTDAAGVAQFTLDTTAYLGQFEILASLSVEIDRYVPYRTPYYDHAFYTVSRLRPASEFTPVVSGLEVKDIEGDLKCGEDAAITVKYSFVGEDFQAPAVDIIYMALSKGHIVHHGFTQASVAGSKLLTTGEVSFKLPVRPQMAPTVQVVVYCVLPSETVLANSRKFEIQKCFANKVSVQFSPPRALPGEKGSLQLSAQPGSLCGLSAVDQSVSLLEPGKQLDAEKVYDLLPYFEGDVRYGLRDPEECLEVRPRRSVPPRPYYPRPRPEKGAITTFYENGLKVVSNLLLKTPDCLLFKGERYRYSPDGEYGPIMYRHHHVVGAAPGPGMRYDSPDGGYAEPAATVRTVFPETWIWDLAEVGASGDTEVPLTVPDTITTWETEAFCLHPQGFGLAPPVQLTVFQPFFLELSLPYSIVRGETFQLKATVFNYLPKCIRVTVTPAPSSDFTLSPVAEGQYSSCLCANGRKTFSWTLVPSVLGVMNVTVSAEAGPSEGQCGGNELVTVPEKGRIDTVTRPLLVKAEGVELSKSFNWLLCPKGNTLTEEVELTLPAEVVKGSARASVAVLGDIMGRALKNIDSLLQMPYGCGEQNMAILSPNIYILQYLQNTGQLTPDIKEKATNFLKNGYQRQLNYKHRDGAYSTFGRGLGNTWLTAFVLRSFGKAKSFVTIDPQVISSATTWLEAKRRPDGVYDMQGSLFNNRMKGGVKDDVTITAYIAAAMLELQLPLHEATQKYLKSSVNDVSNTYATALRAYAFSLAGEEDIRAQLLKHLDSVATSDGSLLHWSKSSSEKADSLGVETSAYVLLASLTKPTLTAADLGYAARIVSWLVKQQNPYGGFSSTQDTVVALQALALYATKVFSPQGSSTVTVQAAGGAKQQFDVNQHNSLLYQERALQDVPGKYSVEVKGSACASVGVSLFYNIPTPTDQSTLSISAHAKPLAEGECNKATAQAFTLEVELKYSGQLESTNMAIVDVAMLSGFSADADSVESLKRSLLVDRVDKKDDHILVYLTQVPKEMKLRYQLTIRQDLPVSNLKPAVVKVYDYYQPSDQAEAEYSYPCA